MDLRSSWWQDQHRQAKTNAKAENRGGGKRRWAIRALKSPISHSLGIQVRDIPAVLPLYKAPSKNGSGKWMLRSCQKKKRQNPPHQQNHPPLNLPAKSCSTQADFSSLQSPHLLVKINCENSLWSTLVIYIFWCLDECSTTLGCTLKL